MQEPAPPPRDRSRRLAVWRGRAVVVARFALPLIVAAVLGLIVVGGLMTRTASGALLGVAVATFLGWVAATMASGAGSSRRVPSTAARRSRDPRPDAWLAAVHRFDVLRAGCAAFECDPLAVLRLPALADVTVAATARFVDAFALAQALQTDRFPPARHADRFVAAVESAEQAHAAAVAVAERIRLSTFAPDERRTIERAVKVLGTARHTDNLAERALAYATARALLAGLERRGSMTLPGPAADALATAARPEPPALPAGNL